MRLKRKGYVNEFAKNLSEFDAYFLGLVMSDGCITMNNGYPKLQLTQNSKDDHILKEIHSHYKKGSLNYYKDSSGYKEQHRAVYVLYDRDIVRGLMELAVTERKSGKEAMPKLPPNLVRHFLRGYFDGDGYVMAKYNDKSKRNIHRIGITSSEDMCITFNSIFESELRIKPKKYRQNGKSTISFVVEYCGKDDLIKIYDFLYDEATIKMNRKYDTFTSLVEGLNSKETHHGRLY